MSLALLASALEAQLPAEAAPAADPKPQVAKVASRPDLVSAVVTARSQGSRVEVESLRSETSTTWANPDGAMTTEAHMAPIRFKTSAGAWQSIDLTLATATDGTVAPRAHQFGVQLGKRNATLVIAPDKKWLLAPDRLFPVTVDPTYANATVMPTFDTFVQSGWPDDLSSTVDLRVGKNGTKTERSFLNFAGSAFHGKNVVAAHLSLMQYGSTTCTATQMNLHASAPASTSTRSASMPVTSQQVWGSVSAAKGFSSACAADRVYVDMTGLAQYWSGTTDATVAVMLKAANETDANAWKRFYSTEGPADPYISLTWNRPANAPATVETTEAIAYAAPTGDTASYMYSPSLRPWVQTKATDPDGSTVKYVFEFFTGSGPTFSLKGTCTSSVYASGTTAGCRPAADLPDNTLLYVRAKANDGRIDGPWTSYQTRLRIGAAKPADPVVSCPAPYDVNNSWQDTAPTADVVCTITATGTGYNAPGYLRITVDGKPVASNTGVAGQWKVTPSSDPAVAKKTVTIPHGTPGLHPITAQAETPAGKLSDAKTHNFGWGGTALTSPTSTPRITTANTVRITASGPPKGQSSSVTAKVRWRVSGYGGVDDLVGWNEDALELGVDDKGAGGVVVNTTWDTMNARTDANLDSDPDTAGVQPTQLNDRVPVKLDIQVCFTYGTSTVQCTWSQTPDTTIQRVPHAFGNGYPTSDAGPGQVALWTGEFNASATDVLVPGYSGGLSIARSHMTYETPTNQINGAFGQGWTAEFDGAEAGAAGMQVIDQTRIDGTLVLIDGDGTSLIYQSPSKKRRTIAMFEPGDWNPVDEETELDGSRLTITGTTSAPVLSYIEDDGTITTWTTAAAPTATAAALFRAVGISEPGIAGKTTFSYDANGRVVRILAPPAPGVTCGAFNAAAPLTGMNPGCRALHFTYTTIGASKVRLSGAWLDIYDPDKTGSPGMASIQVAAYTYDTNALLTKVTDPRSNLSTEYTYNTSNHLTSMKPAGQVAYQFNYVTVDQRAKLDSVTRARPAGDPAGGTATLGKYIYSIPMSGDGLPDLSAGSVARWNQKAVPANGFAVFGPDHPLTAAPGSGDWQYADLQYTDASGRTINTAKYGAGDWQYTSIDYDDQGNVVRGLDERALRAVIDNNMPGGATVDQLANVTVYNPDIKNAAGTVVTPAGTLVTDTYGPARYASLKNGAVAWIRPHTHTMFDQAAPNAGINPDTQLPYRLGTAVTVSAQDPGTGEDIEVLRRTLTSYKDPITSDMSSWALSLAATTTTDMDLDATNSTGDIVKLTRYDSEGRVTETRQPTSNGSDAGTTKTVYYTTSANPQFAECGSKPQWAGLICKKYQAASPTGLSGATPTLPSTSTSAYTYMLAPKSVLEASGAATRTTSMSYLPDGRISSVKTAVSGLPASNPNTEKVTTYDTATGQPTVLTAMNADGTTAGTITTSYDTWSRQVAYQSASEVPTTTVYDAAGSVATVTDGNGSTHYKYGATDANGRAERRNLVTKVDVITGGSTWTSTSAYDAAGAMTTQRLPGGISRVNQFDGVGIPISVQYSGQVTTVNGDGSSTVDPNGPWLSWSLENDVTGHVTHEWTPEGNAFTTSTGGAIPYDRRYTYDPAGRLTQVNDRTAGTSGIDITDPANAPACLTRTYGFDANDNRLTKATAPAASDGSCATTGADVTTRAFDSADRPVTGANGSGTYTYDPLGRTTTVPASDAPRQTDGDISVAYYDNDLVRSVIQGTASTTYTLDALDRRSLETTTNTSGTIQKVSHYTDTSDNPTWVATGSTWHRYTKLTGPDLSLVVDSSGNGRLMITNPHGDLVSSTSLAAANGSAVALEGWASYDEYGNPTDLGSAGSGGTRYGWLGGAQRATQDIGLILMGVRLYNAATGLFTSRDPIPGGGANAYAYPTEPNGTVDLTGAYWVRTYWWGEVYKYHRYWSFASPVYIYFSRSGTSWLSWGSGAASTISGFLSSALKGSAQAIALIFLAYSAYIYAFASYAVQKRRCLRMRAYYSTYGFGYFGPYLGTTYCGY